MFFFSSYFYFITIALQVICVIHCLRRGSQTNWLWLIIFLPLIGCIAYIVLEIFPKGNVQQMRSGVGNTFYPSGKIKKLEKQLEFADTFNNRILLADAYLSAGNTTRAIELYETSLKGAFTENEHVLMQLIKAYFEVQRYDDLIKIARKIYNRPQFTGSHAHVLYAMALSKAGDIAGAEKEFNTMKTRYSYFEARYQYALFLLNENRQEEAEKLLKDMINEFSYLSSYEKRNNRLWFNYARQELKKVTSPAARA